MAEHWKKDEVFERVAGILVESFEIDRDEIRLDAHVVDDLDLDSIDAIDLAVGLRDATGLELSEDELKSVTILGDIIDLVTAKLPAA